MNAGVAAGGGYGGLAADLHDQQAMHRLYLTAAAVGLVSAAVIALSGPDRGRPATGTSKYCRYPVQLRRAAAQPRPGQGGRAPPGAGPALYAQFNADDPLSGADVEPSMGKVWNLADIEKYAEQAGRTYIPFPARTDPRGRSARKGEP